MGGKQIVSPGAIEQLNNNLTTLEDAWSKYSSASSIKSSLDTVNDTYSITANGWVRIVAVTNINTDGHLNISVNDVGVFVRNINRMGTASNARGYTSGVFPVKKGDVLKAVAITNVDFTNTIIDFVPYA